MMHKTVVLSVAGLTPSLLGEHTPKLAGFCSRGKMASVMENLPALSCSTQATYLTGKTPSEHGIVASGWYARDECEVKLRGQSDRLVTGPKIWDIARDQDPGFRCANLFWRHNMYSEVDISVSPRPICAADGRTMADIYTKPRALRAEMQDELGQFPLLEFWGPAASIDSSRWIASCARLIEERYDPTLTLLSLPHLDFGLHKFGPDSPELADELEALDHVAGSLITFYEERAARVLLLSEYGVVKVDRPVHLNRQLRGAGLLTVREEMGSEMLDAGASAAFALADHQVAHIYINNPRLESRIRTVIEETPGVARVLDADEMQSEGLDHARSGDLVALSELDAWFTYYYWLDDNRAPDFARTVDLHRKPGCDPVELFVDPDLRAPWLKIGRSMLKEKLGFRALMDVVPLDASLIKGSHGRRGRTKAHKPLVATNEPNLMDGTILEAREVFDLIGRHLGVTAQNKVSSPSLVSAASSQR